MYEETLKKEIGKYYGFDPNNIKCTVTITGLHLYLTNGVSDIFRLVYTDDELVLEEKNFTLMYEDGLKVGKIPKELLVHLKDTSTYLHPFKPTSSNYTARRYDHVYTLLFTENGVKVVRISFNPDNTTHLWACMNGLIFKDVRTAIAKYHEKTALLKNQYIERMRGLSWEDMHTKHLEEIL